MADIKGKDNAATYKQTGPDEAAEQSVNVNEEAAVRSSLDNGGEDGIIVVTNSTAVEVKVGASVRALRKTVIVQSDQKIYFGFSATTQTFLAQKNQMFYLAFGPNTELWVKAVSTTANVSVGEIS